MTINEDILDASISHSVWLERYKTQNVNKILKILNKATQDEVLGVKKAKLLSPGLAVEDKKHGCVMVVGQKYKTGDWIDGGFR